MVPFFRAQNDSAMPQKSITQSSDWIGSCLIAKSSYTSNFESTIGAKIFGVKILPPNSQIRPLKTDRISDPISQPYKLVPRKVRPRLQMHRIQTRSTINKSYDMYISPRGIVGPAPPWTLLAPGNLSLLTLVFNQLRLKTTTQ